MKKLISTNFKKFYTMNEYVAHTSPMHTHYLSKNFIERTIWQSKLESMRHTLSSINYHTVLDIGCGDGGLLKTIRSDSEYTGIDISPTQLGYFQSNLSAMKRTHKGRIKLLQHDVMQLPIPNASVDLVLACDVLEHVLRPKKLIGEIYRVIKPGGYGLFSIPNEPVWEILRVLSGRWPPRSPDHLYFIEAHDITDAFDTLKAQTFLPIPLPPFHLIHIMLVGKKM